MKIHRLNAAICLLAFFPFLIRKNTALSLNTAPFNSKVVDLLQTIDKESNVTANTKKLTFKLLLKPVDNENQSLHFVLKLKSALWLTSDEFVSLRNYLSDTDISNALKIVRRKFFRRYMSKSLVRDALKYRLLSAVAFSSIQGSVNVLRNRLNDQNPELLVMVSDYKVNHKNNNDWKPLESNDADFEFHVENGDGPTPLRPSIHLGSVFDRSFYENFVFNSMKSLVTGPTATESAATPEFKSAADQAGATAENKPEEAADKGAAEFKPATSVPERLNETPLENLETSPGEESSAPSAPTATKKRKFDETLDTTSTKTPEGAEKTAGDALTSSKKVFLGHQHTPAEALKEGTTSTPETGKTAENTPKPTVKPEKDNADKDLIDFDTPANLPETQNQTQPLESTTSPNAPEQKAHETTPREQPEQATPESTLPQNPPPRPPPPNRRKRKRDQAGEVDFYRDKDRDQEKPESREETVPPAPTPQSPMDNNVVDPENPTPTEEIKSKDGTEQEETPKVPEVTESQPEPGPSGSSQPVKATDVTPQESTAEGQKVGASESGENFQAKESEAGETSDTTEAPENSSEAAPSSTEGKTSSSESGSKPEAKTPGSEAENILGDSISNVRKGGQSNLKTTFSLSSPTDGPTDTTKFYKNRGPSASSDSETSDNEETNEESDSEEGTSEEKKLKELQKRFPPYNETELMNVFERVDTEDVEKGFKSPLTITLKINFLSSDSRISVPVITTAKLLLPKTIFTMCIREELTQQCAFELKDRLMARFEDNNSQAFKWGRLVSLLQALALQNDVFVHKYVMESGVESEIELSKPSFILPMKTLNFLHQLEGKVSSSDNEASLSFEVLKTPFTIPEGSTPSDLGQNYGVHAQMTRFIDLYGDLEITHSLYDLPKSELSPKKKDSSKRRIVRPEDNRVFTMDELLSMNVDTKDLSKDIHFILSGYEKALFSVPKRLSGYKLLWETVDKYPELQRLWTEALTLMKLMDPKDNLKSFLANHTFKYQELKDLFEITYGIIAADNFDAARDFYETVGITQKDVDTNLARVKSLFFAKTGSNVTRLPPMLKPMHPNCLIKNMITSLSSNDLVERFQVMYVQWLNDYKNSGDGSNYSLAFLCAGSAVLLQHWHYFQLDQSYHDHPVPFITLITSFSRLAQGKYKNPERKKEIKELINSKAAKQCRKYINAAGILATSPYRTANINMTPKSLLGAIGNALDVSMDSPPEEVAYAMKDYFKAELNKGKFGNSLGICMGLQLLHRLSTCLSVERSNDFSVYMHGLLTMDTRPILERYTELETNTKNINKNHGFLKFACNPDNATVHEAMAKLMPLVSTQSHIDMVEELVRRDMLSPDLTPEGYLATNDETLNKDVVDLEDDTTTLLENFEDTNPRSLLEIADEISYGDDIDPTEPSFIQQKYTHGGQLFDVDVVGMPDLEVMDGLYRKLFSPLLVGGPGQNSLNHKALNQLFNPTGNARAPDSWADEDLALITFDVRMEPAHSRDELIVLDVPFSFHVKELDMIESLESKALVRLLLYRIKKRIDSLQFDLKHDELKRQALELAKARNVEHISMPVHDSVARGNVDLNTYTGLLRVLESMPEDGFYFEHEGLVVPEERVGRLAAKQISSSLHRGRAARSGKKHASKVESREPVMTLQIIDPVDDTDIGELTMPHEHVKKHDRLFYQKMTEL